MMLTNRFLFQMGDQIDIPDDHGACIHPVYFHSSDADHFPEKDTICNLFHGTKEDELNTETIQAFQLDLGVKEDRLAAAKYFGMKEWCKIESSLSESNTSNICNRFYQERWALAIEEGQEALTFHAAEYQHRLVDWISAWCNSKYTESQPCIKTGTLDTEMFCESDMDKMTNYRPQKQKFKQAKSINFTDVCEEILNRDRDKFKNKRVYSPLLSPFRATAIILRPTKTIKEKYGEGMNTQNLLTLLRRYSQACKEDKSQSGSTTLMDSVGLFVQTMIENTPPTANWYEPKYDEKEMSFNHGNKLNIKKQFDSEDYTEETYQEDFPDPAYFAWPQMKEFINSPLKLQTLNNLQYRLLTKAISSTRSETDDPRNPETVPSPSSNRKPKMCPPYIHTLDSFSVNVEALKMDLLSWTVSWQTNCS